ncbi:MAG: SIR2 family protein [Christensenellaceae bacterium]
MVSTDEFIREYTRAVSEGYAAVFAGAGLSRDAGYASWKDLVRPLADDIGLNVDKENDLVAVAQYYRNERGNRFSINQRIINEFTKNVSINENIKTLTRLPISTYWTTNYDELLEEGLKENNRKADIKITQQSLADNIYDRDAVVYKMHGDVRCPEKAVLTKDDYEIYENERPLFRTVLQGDLVSKTFLFIGFSFEDPNLDYILGQIRLLLGESTRDHYCFFEIVKQQEGECPSDYSYRKAKQELRIKDLRRYGIQAILLNSYAEITGILSRIEHGTLSRSIFISGSISDYSVPWTKEIVELFAFSLAKKLVHDNYKIVSGFGLGIGSSVINGALEEIMHSKYKHVDEHLCLRPFPQVITGATPRDQLWKKYREDMINQSGVAIFVFGNKMVNNDTVSADGMLQEFEIAKRTHTAIIPIGSTGWAASKIFDDVRNNIEDYPYLESYLEDLGTCTDLDKLLALIGTIVSNLQSN